MVNKLILFYRRNIQTVLLVVICFCAFGSLLLIAQSVAQQKEAITKQNETLASLKHIAEQISRTASQSDKHLDCVTEFFAQKDRSSKAIADIDACRIANTPAQSTPKQTSGPSAPIPTAAAKPTPTKKGSEAPNKNAQPILDGILQELGLKQVNS